MYIYHNLCLSIYLYLYTHTYTDRHLSPQDCPWFLLPSHLASSRGIAAAAGPSAGCGEETVVAQVKVHLEPRRQNLGLKLVETGWNWLKPWVKLGHFGVKICLLCPWVPELQIWGMVGDRLHLKFCVNCDETMQKSYGKAIKLQGQTDKHRQYSWSCSVLLDPAVAVMSLKNLGALGASVAAIWRIFDMPPKSSPKLTIACGCPKMVRASMKIRQIRHQMKCHNT